jgi:nucleoside-diphosphate-sugar epimerase
VRLLSVARRAASRDTCLVPQAANRTAFVTGAAGFIGMELVKALVARGCHVFALTRSPDSARHLRRAGAVPVIGDLLAPGGWQDEAAADWVFHIPPCAASAPHVASMLSQRTAAARAAMDTHLLDAIAAGSTKRVVYVADARCYGPTPARAVTEDEVALSPERWRCLTPALDRLDGYVIAGLPIVTALPGFVYGNTLWFRQWIVDPIMTGRRVMQFGKAGPWVSPIHVRDCARALVHLAERGEPGGRYFIANSEAIRLDEFATGFARAANRPLRVWRLPSAAAALLAERPLTDYLHGNLALSNIRLRGIGFRFDYPTLEEGLEQVYGALHEC